MFRKLTLAAILACTSLVAGAQSPSAEEVVDRQLSNYYMAGKDFTAKISMRLLNAQGSQRERALVLWRLNVGKAGDQRYLISFDSPADVRGMAFLVWKYSKKEDERWLYFPALKAVKRIAADDKRSSFVGSDFTYEDISGRDVDEEKHVLLRREPVGDRPAYVIESTPKSNATYARRVSWIDGERWLPLKEEYYDAQGKIERTFKADKVESVAGHWTVTARSMTNNQTGHRTEVVFTAMRYDGGLVEDMFAERSLRNPPVPPQ
jgi:outer membrane lipoprotein-sorting protein